MQRVTPATLRSQIAETLWAHVSAKDLAQVCVYLGLEPQRDPYDDNPMASKRSYVARRLLDKGMDELLDLGGRVAAEYGDSDLEALLRPPGARGVDGELKNLIFAADGPKPRIVLRDAINNVIEIVEHAQHCLVYDQPLSQQGLSWRHLVQWWSTSQAAAGQDEYAAARALYVRLDRALANEAERLIHRTYSKNYGTSGFDIPALIPQVYLHYDPYTQRDLGTTPGPLSRQRMDFLLLLPGSDRVVIELDGVQHYADAAGSADPRRYAEMVREDRALRLAGYEVYRFGGAELRDHRAAAAMLSVFFDRLLARHGISLCGDGGHKDDYFDPDLKS